MSEVPLYGFCVVIATTGVHATSASSTGTGYEPIVAWLKQPPNEYECQCLANESYYTYAVLFLVCCILKKSSDSSGPRCSSPPRGTEVYYTDAFSLRVLVYSVTYDSGQVSLEHFLLSRHPSQPILGL